MIVLNKLTQSHKPSLLKQTQADKVETIYIFTSPAKYRSKIIFDLVRKCKTKGKSLEEATTIVNEFFTVVGCDGLKTTVASYYYDILTEKNIYPPRERSAREDFAWLELKKEAERNCKPEVFDLEWNLNYLKQIDFPSWSVTF